MHEFTLHFTTPPRFIPLLESILEHPPDPPMPRDEILRMEQVLRWKYGYVLCQLFEYFERKPTPGPPLEPMYLQPIIATKTKALTAITVTVVPSYTVALDSFTQLYYFHKLRPPDVMVAPCANSFYRAYFFCRGRPPEVFVSNVCLNH
jgi:hypothetical protein